MKVKYIKEHNNYSFKIGNEYEVQKYNDKWILIDGQLYRIECFEPINPLSKDGIKCESK